jgi:riboflavin synthase
MFTGIITDIGRIVSVDKAQGDWLLRIATRLGISAISLGDSIACSGVCLTVIKKEDSCFWVQVSNETLSKTAIGTWQVDTPLNLELSLNMGDPLGGHLVFGHVDGLAEVVSIEPIGESHHVVVRLPQHLKHFAATKGSIALDGISLTVNDVQDDLVHLNIIPHTWKVTTWNTLQVGQKIHVEVDMLARYVARLQQSTEQNVQSIIDRNKRVEADKAWETSWARKGLISVITFVLATIAFKVMGAENALTAAIIPVLGYILSTLTLPFAKERYIQNFSGSKEK